MAREKTQMQKMEARMKQLVSENIFMHGLVEGLKHKPPTRDGMERNPEARCGNCVHYFAWQEPKGDGNCHRGSEQVPVWEGYCCSHHSDFWRVKQEKATEAEQVKEASTRG